MIRSRVELVNFMGEMERERHCHAEELDDAGKRQSELEVALRAADEVLGVVRAYCLIVGFHGICPICRLTKLLLDYATLLATASRNCQVTCVCATVW